MARKNILRGNTVNENTTALNDNFTELYNAVDDLSDSVASAGKVDDVTFNGSTVVTNKVAAIPRDLSKYDNSTSKFATTSSVSAAQTKADDAYTLAEGRARAVSFDTVAAMTTALKAASSAEYKIGDNIFIKATDVPDYWVSGVLSTNTGTYGYYEVSILETQKVDLTPYQKKTDNTLDTSSKDVVGAINEVHDYYSGLTETVGKIVNGTTTVGKAAVAVKDANGRVIDTTYATKTELSTKTSTLDDKITNIESGATKVGSASTADSATAATKATQDAKGNVIDTTYATKTQLKAATDDITKIKNGTTTVGKATEATKATQDADGNVITSTYATKTEMNAVMKKVTLPTPTVANNIYTYIVSIGSDYEMIALYKLGANSVYMKIDTVDAFRSGGTLSIVSDVSLTGYVVCGKVS